MPNIFLDDNAILFTVPAIVGSTVFIARLGMMLIGGAMDFGDADGSGGDIGDAGDFPDAADLGDDAQAHHDLHDSETYFKILSIQSVAAFLMGAGWGGLGAFKGIGLDLPISVVIAALSGAFMMWLLAIMFRLLFAMQASGNISIHDTVGKEADVSITVPESRSGVGEVTVVINGTMRNFQAVTEGEQLDRTTRTRITHANPDNTVTVARA